MLEWEPKYNEYGEVIDEEIEAVVVRHFESSIVLNGKEMHEAVINYRLSKNPNKLSDFERCSITDEVWIPVLNKKQRERLKNA